MFFQYFDSMMALMCRTVQFSPTQTLGPPGCSLKPGPGTIHEMRFSLRSFDVGDQVFSSRRARSAPNASSSGCDRSPAGRSSTSRRPRNSATRSPLLRTDPGGPRSRNRLALAPSSRRSSSISTCSSAFITDRSSRRSFSFDEPVDGLPGVVAITAGLVRLELVAGYAVRPERRPCRGARGTSGRTSTRTCGR